MLPLSEKYKEELKTASNIELTLGPLGGFKYLHFEYMSDGIPCNSGTDFKKEAEAHIEYFKSLGKNIVIK